MRITNINTLSALIDRLTTEHVKKTSFYINGDHDKVIHQEHIINEIINELNILFEEINQTNKYVYLKEFRTIKPGIVDHIENVIKIDLENIEAEKCRVTYLNKNKVDLMTTLKNDLWLRIGNELRANIKNTLDEEFDKFIERTDEDLISYAYKIDLSQVHEEVQQLINFIKNKNLHNFVEIGTKFGGNFFILSNLIDGLKISIDLPLGVYGGWVLDNHPYLGNVLEKRNTFLSSIHNTQLIIGDSHKIETEQMVFNHLKNNKIDLLYIDGDHTYEGVKKDFTMYSKFVSNNGYIIFHDINNTKKHRDENCEVWKFWQEIQGEKIEFNSNKEWAGIGVLLWKN